MTDREHPRLPPDPSGIEAPHDVLAAEEFAVPMRDPTAIPTDPIRAPHDVLAAEQFAIPTAGGGPYERGRIRPGTLLPCVVLGALTALLLVRIMRR